MVALHRTDTFAVTCRHCQKSHTLLVNITDVADWKLGKYIQDAMPYLSADERELCISQTCGVCWDEMFGDPEDA
tara:strand:- start:190 stop:411 length:222 start_codon:yes stop_codon:yes gene_type:complete